LICEPLSCGKARPIHLLHLTRAGPHLRITASLGGSHHADEPGVLREDAFGGPQLAVNAVKRSMGSVDRSDRLTALIALTAIR
jgi:hypothetical protein